MVTLALVDVRDSNAVLRVSRTVIGFARRGKLRKRGKCQDNDRLGTRQHRARGVGPGKVSYVSCHVLCMRDASNLLYQKLFVEIEVAPLLRKVSSPTFETPAQDIIHAKSGQMISNLSVVSIYL